jgi:photosystem II stability/assembly factor-like uncharacterized protein
MNINIRLNKILIWCLVIIAAGWPASQVLANQSSTTTATVAAISATATPTTKAPVKAATKTTASTNTTYHYYIPNYSIVTQVEALGPDGGGVTTALLDPKNPLVAYAGTWGAGVYKSLDDGKTWKSSSQGLANLYVQSMAIDPIHPEILYTGTYHSGVYKSIDAGASWFYAGSGLNTDAIVYALAIDPTNPSTIYAGTRSPGSNPPWGGGVYKSGDGGATWINHNWNLGEDWVYGLAVDPSNPQIVYAATHSQGVWKSTNGAHGWTQMVNGFPDQSTRTIAIDPSNSQVLYAGVWHTTGVYKSTNAGQSWSVVSNGLNSAKIISVIVDPVHPQTVYALSYLQGLYKTDNGGGSWGNVGLSPDYVFGLTINPSNRQDLLASAVNVAMYHSTNGGGGWTNSSSGLHAITIDSVVTDPNVAGLVYAGSPGYGVFRSSDSGKTWASANSGLSDLNVRSLALVSGALYVGTDGGGIYKTAVGQSLQPQSLAWHAINSGLPKTAAKSIAKNPALERFTQLDPAADLFVGEPASAIQPKAVAISTGILALAPAPSSAAVLYAGTKGSGVYRTGDAGASWQAAGLDGKTVFSVVVDRSNPAIVYAGTDAAGGSLWKTADSGAHWSQIQSGVAGLDVLSLSQNPAQNTVVYAGTNNGVFQSSNSGTSWTSLGLSGNSVYALKTNPLAAYNLAAGTTAGLFLSSSSGASWSKQEGLVNPNVWALAFGGAKGSPELYAGTEVSGLYRVFYPSQIY